MQQRPRSPHTPIRWLHQLANLMAQVSRAERIASGDESLQARRLRQRMALAQRLLDPLPAPLRPNKLAGNLPLDRPALGRARGGVVPVAASLGG